MQLVEKARSNSTGNDFVRIYIPHIALHFIYPLCTFISFPLPFPYLSFVRATHYVTGEQNQKREKRKPCYVYNITPQIWFIFEIKAAVGIET
jgi:hypothetical protein